MVFITILLFTVTYIFAIGGVIFFESYTRSDRQDLVFHQSFRFIANRIKLHSINRCTPHSGNALELNLLKNDVRGG